VHLTFCRVVVLANIIAQQAESNNHEWSLNRDSVHTLPTWHEDASHFFKGCCQLMREQMLQNADHQYRIKSVQGNDNALPLRRYT